jgi:hypothetical protein
MSGSLPPADVDHINREKGDNRWVNLRLAARWENTGNAGLQSNNTSGHRGVTWDKWAGKWLARGMRDGRNKHLGYFDSLEEAAAAAQSWQSENFGPFAGA